MKFLFLLFAFLFVSCNSEKVELAFDARRNENLKYELNISLDALALPESDSLPGENLQSKMHILSDYRLLASFDDGSAKYQVKLDSIHYESNKREKEEWKYLEKYLKEQSFQYKMAKDGFILGMPVMDSFVPVLGNEDLDLTKIFLKLQPVLPGKRVSVGESWRREHAFHEKAFQTVIYKEFTLKEIFNRAGKRLAKIEMRISYKQLQEDASVKMESTDFIVGSGFLLFDLTDGCIEESAMEISGNMKIADKVFDKNLPDIRVHQILKMRRI